LRAAAAFRYAAIAVKVPRAQYPWWVKLSCWGVPGRAGLWACVLIALLAALILFLYSVRNPRFVWVGVLAVLTAVPYWQSIRWIDRHGSWDDSDAS
jgi:hypothetical protein